MSESRFYTVRPLSKPARADLKDVLRVYLAPASLLLHKLHPGDLCSLKAQEGNSMPAIAWNSPDPKLQGTIVQTSRPFQLLHGLKLGDKVSVHREDSSIKEVNNVVLSELTQDGSESVPDGLDRSDQLGWEWILECPLKKAEYLCSGMIFESVEAKDRKRTFKIAEINSSRAPSSLYRFVRSSTIRLQSETALDEVEDSLSITEDNMGGLKRQIYELNKRFAKYNGRERDLDMPSWYRPHRGGILLHGPLGTGKSMILRKVSEAKWRKVVNIDASTMKCYSRDTDEAVGMIFTDALQHQPSVLIIDNLESKAGASRYTDTEQLLNIAQGLCDGFDRLDNARVLVIAATTSLNTVNSKLRRPGRFNTIIEIPAPDWKARGEILRILSHLHQDDDAKYLEALEDRTHGFVGADLDELIHLAAENAEERIQESQSSKESVENNTKGDNQSITDSNHQKNPTKKVEVTQADFDDVIGRIRPTAMQGVFLETPKVYWRDIGGQSEVKKTLQQAIEWSFKYPAEMARLGAPPKRALLLYGPPGCSKTLTAKAIATESSLNFLAVKGAELLNMYVGESERAIREIFRKARAAKPSIIFFDEIDAIGAAREGKGGGLNVLTTLLNEMDGIEALDGVFVLAATNKPEILDPALMRPGRLGEMLYVGPPDYEARCEIFQIRTRSMDVGGDFELAALAQLTEGLSGAEITDVCGKAAYAALDEQLREGVQQHVCKRHFEKALAGVKPMITREMKEMYERWERNR